jgi:hypothetical protein
MGAWDDWNAKSAPSQGFGERLIFFSLWQIIKLPFTLIALPFQLISKSNEASEARSNAEKEAEREAAHRVEVKAAIEQEERNRADAYAALPIVEKMTATVSVRGKTVFLQIALTEQERAAIQQNQLGGIVIESTPMFSEEELEESAHELESHLKTIDPILDTDGFVDGLRRDNRKHIDQRRQMNHETKLAQYLDPLFKRPFETPYEANEYADKLKTKILPEIKKIIASNMRIGESTETIEL